MRPLAYASEAPVSDTASRMTRVLTWLTSSRTGRTVLVTLLTMALLQVLRPFVGASTLLDTLGLLTSVVLLGAGVVVVGQWVGRVQRVLLWRVRRKLLLSYFLIGVVPAFLLVVFFAIVGLLLFFNVGAYMLRTQVATFVDRVRVEAESTAAELRGVTSRAEAEAILSRRQQAIGGSLPTLALVLLDGDGRCESAAPSSSSWAGVAAGPRVDGLQALLVPAWVPCQGHASLVDEGGPETESHVAVRAVAWLPGQSRAVLAHVALDTAVARQLSADTGVSVVSIARLDDLEAVGEGTAAGNAVAPSNDLSQPTRRLRLGPVQIPLDPEPSAGFGRSLRWASFLESTDWADGRRGVVFAELGVDFIGVYRRLMSTPTPAFAEVSFAQVLLILLGVVASLFFLLQLVAYVMGFALARSITGAVHALFEGTEQVRKGDLSHKISLPSHDQLGELASSFNTMTGSIEELLQQKAQKDRLEQELSIARDIQMSLLPQAPLACSGVLFAGHCEPARAVGGDYYDFWSIDDHRFGMLIADVAGKGTSAALYMAELKGIVFSLSQSHSSPRQLLIDANRIISRHLDPRSFITMTYGVVDVGAATLTYARAGHCPLIRLPGLGAPGCAPEILSPDGLVLGLQIDDRGLFERLLEEVTLPLAAGDVFMLYTDGVTEAMSPDGEFFGEDRLSALAQLHARGPFPELRTQVLDAVTTFVGASEQQDDITMLVLQIQNVGVAA